MRIVYRLWEMSMFYWRLGCVTRRAECWDVVRGHERGSKSVSIPKATQLGRRRDGNSCL